MIAGKPTGERGAAPMLTEVADAAVRAAGLDQFVQRDVIPALRSITKNTREIVQGLVEVAAPRVGVKTPILDRIYQLKGDREKAEFIFRAVVEHAASLFGDKADKGLLARVDAARSDLDAYKLTPQQKLGVDFMDRLKTGQEQRTVELQNLAELFRKLDDQIYTAVKDYKDSLPYLENHARVLWKVIPGQPEAKGFLGNFRRPLQGSKGFLKQHKLTDMSEGIRLGGVPVSYNPFELLTNHYVDAMKFVTAREWFNQSKKAGDLEFVRQGGDVPDSFEKINDGIAKVYFPAEVKIKEAFDQQVRDRLENLARTLGIKHVRKASIGGTRLGYATEGKPEVVTKFGTPDVVLAHEVGHQLEWRYKIADLLKARDYPERTKELRALADLRFENQPNASDSFRKYVRGKDEKMANAIAALIYAPEKFKATAPNTWDYLRDELWHIPELRPVFDVKPSMVLGTAETTVNAGGMIHAGDYYADAGLARLMNNYLSKDYLREQGTAIGALGRTLLGAKNLYTAVELGLSGFHFSAISAETGASSVGLAYQKLWNRGVRQGDWRAALQAIGDFARGVTVAPAARKYYSLGKAAEALLRNEGQRVADPTIADFAASPAGQKLFSEIPEVRKLLDDWFRGGGKIDVYRDYKLQTIQSFRESLAAHNWVGAGVRSLGAGSELIMKPLFEYYIPRIKLAVFLREFSNELAERSDEIAAGRVTREQLARETVDFVDDRFGELNFDNLFWNRTFKTALQIVFRSPSWRLGTLRGAGKAIVGETAEVVNALREGRAPRLTREFAWFLGVATVTAAVGLLISEAFAHHTPQSFKDVLFPRTDPDDPNQRISQPGYGKDFWHIGVDPMSYLTGGTSGMWGRLIDVSRNRDYYREKLWSDSDTTGQKVLRGLEHVAVPQPISLASAKRVYQEGGGPAQMLPGFMGFSKASSTVTDSPAERATHDYLREQMGEEGQEHWQIERARAERRITGLIRAGKEDQALDYGRQAITAGKLTLDDAVRAAERVQYSPLEAGFRRLPLEQAIEVWKVASPEERERLLPHFVDKLERAEKTLPANELSALDAKLTKLGVLASQ